MLPHRPNRLALACLGGLLAAQSTLAQDGSAAARHVSIEPSVSLTETFTNNFDLRARDPRSDAITRLTAGLSFLGTSGPVRGALTYTLSGLVYARHQSFNTVQNQLNARLNTSLIEDRLQLLAVADVSRSALSAFGVQPGGGAEVNGNGTELRRFQLSPTLRGALGGALRYTATLSHTITDAADTSAGDSTASSLLVSLAPASSGRLGWSMDAEHQTSDYKVGRATSGDRLSATGRLTLDDLDLQLQVKGGVERNDISSLSSESYSNWGLGVTWAPSPTTKVTAETEDRFFGRSHALSIDYRTPRTQWRFSQTRALSSASAGSRSTLFDLFFARLASDQPDPILRAALVNAVLSAQGLNPKTLSSGSLLSSGATVQDQQTLSMAWTGPRDVVSLTLSSGKTRSIDAAVTAVDVSGAAVVRQRTATFDVSHRLAPESSLSLVASAQHNSGDNAAQRLRQRRAEAQYTQQLTSRSSVILALRRVMYESGNDNFGETAVIATYGLRF